MNYLVYKTVDSKYIINYNQSEVTVFAFAHPLGIFVLHVLPIRKENLAVFFFYPRRNKVLTVILWQTSRNCSA